MVGPGFYPAGSPEGILPANAPDDRTAPEKVPGAAGRPHAIARGPGMGPLAIANLGRLRAAAGGWLQNSFLTNLPSCPLLPGKIRM